VPAGTGNEDVLAFVPADSAVFMGADLDLIKSELGGLVPLNQWGAGNGGMPPGLMESLSKIDKVVVAMQVDNAADPEIAVIMRTKIPYKEEEMRLSFKGEDRQTAHGKVYYKIPVAAVNQPGVFGQAKSSRRFLVGMPNDRIVLFGNMAPARLESVLASDGTKPNISGETLALVQDVDKSTAWFAVHVTEKMRREMAQNPNGFAGLGPKIGTAKDAIARVKGVAGTFSFAGALKATLSLTCANGNDARQIADTFRKLWDTDGKKAVPQLVLGVRLFGGNDLASALNEACSSLQFSQNGAKATASLSVTKPTLEKAIKEVQRLAQQMGGMGGPPKMNNPSRMGRPPNMPAPGPRKIGP
jgi:hypothetical protein